MSEFLERHKRKSILGLLLLLLRGRKTLVALLVVALLVSFVFTAPSKFPGVANMLGFGSSGGLVTFSSLRAAFKTAKDNRNLSWSALFSRGAGAPGPSSVGLVRGSAEELGLAGAGGGSGADRYGRSGGRGGAGGADGYDGSAGAGRRVGRSINGIMNPDDAERGGDAVTVGNADLGREHSALTGVSGFGANAGHGQNTNLDGYASNSAGTRLGDNIRSAMEKTNVPGAGSGKAVGASSGRLSKTAAGKLSLVMRQGLSRNMSNRCVSSQRCAFPQLADARTRTEMASAPNCTNVNGCPGEFAATNTGAVYDGNKVGGGAPQILIAPAVDGNATPNPNSDSGAGGAQCWADWAAKADTASQRCNSARQNNEPVISALMARIDELGKQMQQKCGDINWWQNVCCLCERHVPLCSCRSCDECDNIKAEMDRAQQQLNAAQATVNDACKTIGDPPC